MCIIRKERELAGGSKPEEQQCVISTRPSRPLLCCVRAHIYIFVCIYIDIDSLVETGLLMEYIYILALGPINEKSSRVPAVCVSVQKL